METIIPLAIIALAIIAAIGVFALTRRSSSDKPARRPERPPRRTPGNQRDVPVRRAGERSVAVSDGGSAQPSPAPSTVAPPVAPDAPPEILGLDRVTIPFGGANGKTVKWRTSLIVKVGASGDSDIEVGEFDFADQPGVDEPKRSYTIPAKRFDMDGQDFAPFVWAEVENPDGFDDEGKAELGPVQAEVRYAAREPGGEWSAAAVTQIRYTLPSPVVGDPVIRPGA